MKILVVDDSLLFRSAIAQAVSANPDMEVIDKLSNGQEAVNYIKEHPNEIELITMDLEMPELDGISATRAIREFNKEVKIILFSAYTLKGAEKTLEGLEAGADDFVTKPKGNDLGANIEAIKGTLLYKAKSLVNPDSTIELKEKLAKVSDLTSRVNRPDVICIGSSTGGPAALQDVFRGIKSPPKVPMLLVQHMPPVFTKQLAKTLNGLSPVNVKEAKDGDLLEAGVCLVAPGDYHMEVRRNDKGLYVKLNQKDKVCHVRPAVNMTINSLVEILGRKASLIIMTGMGDDGLQGARNLKSAGGQIFIQDKDSSVVWGMPGAIYQDGLQNGVVPLAELSELIGKMS